ncbi:MAG TPA: S8 family peptidase [Bdellovibrionales bacterium]|nr:S8 family peptidase [Bdellovibrionales bacterium]
MKEKVLPVSAWLLVLLLTAACGSTGGGGGAPAAQCGAKATAFGLEQKPLQMDQKSTRYIVKATSGLRELLSRDRFTGLQKRLGLRAPLEAIAREHFIVEFKARADVETGLQSLLKNALIEYAEPDIRVQRFNTPNDPMFQNQWAHGIVQSAAAWDISVGSSSVVVAVLDTGVDYSHPDLRDNIWINPREIAGNGRDDDGNGYVDDVRGYDFANNDNDPMSDDSGVYHGTHTAGTVGASGGNAIGIAGHAPVVKIMPVKFLAGDGGGDLSAAIRAIDYAVANGAKVMNNSWGSPQASRALADAVARARDAGVLFVAASGNGGSDGVGDNNDAQPVYPASFPYDNVISVASSGRGDSLSGFSNYGARTVHVAAPGEDILSTMNGGRYQMMSGTSMASPLVSGVLALMISRRPDLNYQQIKAALLTSVDTNASLQGRVSSGGRVNAFKALRAVSNGGPVVTPPPGGQTPASCP